MSRKDLNVTLDPFHINV